MGRFRCSIAGLMAVVGLVAVDCMMIRAPLSGRSLTAGMLLLGGLPMANLLAAGMLPLLPDCSGHGVDRPWLVGFEVGGAVALFLYASCAYYDPDAIRESVGSALKSYKSFGNPAFLTVVAAALSAPQLGLALLGSWLNRRYGIGITISDRFARDLTTAV